MTYLKDTQTERLRDFWRRYKKNRPAVAGLYMIICLVLLAVFADYIASYDPWESNFAEKLQPPSPRHLMGTDNFGRDVFSRIIYGSRITLLVGFAAAAITISVGVVLGSLAGYFGGIIENANLVEASGT
jgi:ABC-type dipeptide/oligopeptide/nickel transport system permease subunit